jgi:hypothetical protein
VDDPAHTSHLASTRCSTQHPPDRLIGHAVSTRDVTERFPLLDPLQHGCPCRGWDLPARIRDTGNQWTGQRCSDQLGGEEVASTFPVPPTRSHLLATTSALCSEPGTQVSRGWETTALLPAAFFRPLSRCDPCSFRPPLLHCCCAGGSASLAWSCSSRQCVRKRQGKVRQRQAWNVWARLKNVSGSLNGHD